MANKHKWDWIGSPDNMGEACVLCGMERVKVAYRDGNRWRQKYPPCVHKLRKFKYKWSDGTVNEGYGNDSADALNRMGFGQGAVPALKSWEEIT